MALFDSIEQIDMDRKELNRALLAHFNLEELHGLCFELDIGFENFEQKPIVFVRQLIEYCERRSQIQELTVLCSQRRPNFGSVGTSSAISPNLPKLEKKIFGRDALIAEWVGHCTQKRTQPCVLAATGTAGVGKTALALALAHHPSVREHFVDGVLWAGLGQHGDGMTPLAQWAEALGGNVSQLPDPATRAREVQRLIGKRKLLLVIDDAWSQEAALQLRCGGPNCAHLLTTRDDYLAEQFAKLSTQDAGKVYKVCPLKPDDAFALLQLLAPDACDADASAARGLTVSVGGLPIAIEVLGGYLAKPEHSMFAKLSQQAFAQLADPHARLQLTTERIGSKNTQTLQDVIELSLHDLPEVAQRAWYALGAFAHKPALFSLNAAEAVCDCKADTIALLANRNLVERDIETLGLHQMLAEAARESAARGDGRHAIMRHCQFYLDLVNRNLMDWQTIDKAYSQIQFAWENLLDDSLSLKMIQAMRQYQNTRSLWRDQIAWIERGIEICRGTKNRKDEAILLNNLGLIYNWLKRSQQALPFFGRALRIHIKVKNRVEEATTLNNIGIAYGLMGNQQQALAYLKRALPIRKEVNDLAGQATTFTNMGMVYNAIEDPRQALIYYELALPIQEERDHVGLAATLNNIGAVYYKAFRDLQEALSYFERALLIRQEVGDLDGESVTRMNIGFVLADQGKLVEAEEQLTRAVQLCEEISSPHLEAASSRLAETRARQRSSIRGRLKQKLMRLRLIGKR